MALRLSGPVPSRVKFVTPTAAVNPLKIPPQATVPLTVMFSALTPAAPTGKPAALAEFQATGPLVTTEFVAQSAAELSQVPLVDGDNPLLSQNQTAAGRFWTESVSQTNSADNKSRGLRFIDMVGWFWVESGRS